MAIAANLHLPKVQEFLFGIDRVVILPEAAETYLGQLALCFGLLDLTEGHRVYIYLDASTLQVYGVVAA